MRRMHVLLIGSNPRLESPVLNASLRQRWLSGVTVKWQTLDPEVDLSYKVDQLGDSAAVLDKIFLMVRMILQKY